jgi:hypothetical protein
MVVWNKKLAEKAVANAATEILGIGNNFSIKAGQLSYKGVRIPEDKANVIVVASNFNNQFRKGAYDPDNYEAPTCFAFGDTEKDLAPHEKSSHPEAKTCAECPNNEFGSASVGKGKACRQARDLILISADAEKIESAELGHISIPPTSLKTWKGYVHQLNNTLKRPVMSVITEIKAVVIGTYPGVEFKLIEKIDDGSILDAIESREEEAMKLLTKPYEPTEEKPKAKTAKKKRKF